MKRTILIIALGVAFVGASLWLILSGGRSRRATRLKYRLGGAILSLVALASTACGSGGNETPMVSCYDPAPPRENIHFWADGVANSQLRNGDIVVLDYDCMFGEEVKISLLSNDNESERELCSQTYTVKQGGNQLSFTIDAGDYRGRAKLRVLYERYDDGYTYPFDIFVSIVD